MLIKDGIVAVPDMLLPRPGLDLEKWAVVACDQFTSEPAYWDRVEALVGGHPSTLRMILPEVFLAGPESWMNGRIDAINATMTHYLSDGTLRDIGRCVILTRRRVPGLPVRTGLVLAIDLDRYEYKPGNAAPIRATEGTVLERIPPRMRIRENAPLELPHVQLLMDDPGRTVIEPLVAGCESGEFEMVYDTPLMMDGGAICGYRVPDGDPRLAAALGALYRLDSYRSHGLMLAVGDGNHSLVTAKACWERIRAVSGPDHPARYAMAELINLHDDGLEFEPIHRMLFGCPLDRFLTVVRSFYKDDGPGGEQVEILPGNDLQVSSAEDGQPCLISVVSGGENAMLRFPPSQRLAVDRIQPLVDALDAMDGVSVDYIHGESALRELSSGGTGILLPAIDKSRFFPDILRNGIYPRKSFSMGEAVGKRYYFEARRIR